MAADTFSITVQAIATKLGASIHGDKNATICDIKPLEIATASDLSFVAATGRSTTNKKLIELAKRSKAGALLIPQFEESIVATQIVTPNPLGAIAQLAASFRPDIRPAEGIHPTAIVDESATLGESVSVGAYVVIGKNVTIGANTIVHPHVVIYPEASIGQGCIIHSGAVIRESVRVGNDCSIQNGVIVGGDGFGYIPQPGKPPARIPHIGTVVLENHVDLGANTTIDRGTLGETRIGEGTKIDNLVMVGHNVDVGQRSLICGQVGISGSSRIGNEVVLAGQVGVADHRTVGDRARAAAQTGIAIDVPPGADVAGTPNVSAQSWRRAHVFLSKLSELTARLRRIEKSLGVSSEEQHERE